jgi:hypothetical protein
MVATNGFSYLLSSGNNPKTIKSDKGGEYLTAILNLYPGSPEICAWATAGCIEGCLHTAGNPVYQRGKDRARLARTDLFLKDRGQFIRRLMADTAQHCRKAYRKNVLPCVRLNGTSDIAWESVVPEIFSAFPDCQFYDYTKGAHRLSTDWRARRMPPNYDLTLSFSGKNWLKCRTALADGGRVAAVFGGIGRNQPMVASYKGWPVVDGDETDLTFSRPQGTILGLRAKGLAKQDQTGFVIRDH